MKKELMLIELLIKRLLSYNGKKQFTEDEIEDIDATILLLSHMDPDGTYIKTASAGIELGYNHSNKKKAKIIDFSEHKRNTLSTVAT